jgi:hypothetical protein
MALNPQQAARWRGHPTSPGIRDPHTVRRALDQTLDGHPGTPRYKDFPRDMHADPAAQFGTNGPAQPGVQYEGEFVQEATEGSRRIQRRKEARERAQNPA